MESRCEQILADLSSVRGGPCATIYLATTPGKNGCDETVLRFKNLKRTTLSSIKKGYDDFLVDSFERRLDAIEKDIDFWTHQHGGLGIYMAPEYQRFEKLYRGVQDVAIVADRFYLKPLMRQFQSLGQFAVLGVSMNNVSLYVGDRDVLSANQVGELNFTFEDFWGQPNVDHRVGSISVAGNNVAGSKSRSVFHNYDDVHARKKIDLVRYFLAIDEIICKQLASNLTMPVVLAALPEYQDLYRSRSKIRGLLEKGILGNPDVMSLDEIREKAWVLVEPVFDSVTDKVNEEYSSAVVVGRGSDHLLEIAKAIAHGRVGKLIVEDNRQIPGKLMLDTGIVLFADLQNPHVNDVLDDFADVVQQNSGKVIVLPREKMPTDKGVAAIYRY